MAATAEALINTLAGGESGGDQLSDGGTGAGEATGAAAQDSGEGSGSSQTSGGSAGGRSPTGGDSQAGGNPQGAGDGKQAGTGGSATDHVATLNVAIREARSENKALKAQLQELSQKIEALSKPPAKVEEAPPEPDFLADPKAYVDDTRKQIKELTEKLDSKEKQQTEAQQKQQQAQETWNKVIAAESEFAATTPDYHDALNHVRAIRAEQIKIEIRETEEREPTQEEVGRILSIQEAQGAAALIAKGKNPSKFYYEYAKTFGYKPKVAADPATTTTTATAKPDKEAVRTMGSGGAADSGGGDEPAGDSPLGGLLAAAQNEHRAQFKKRK